MSRKSDRRLWGYGAVGLLTALALLTRAGSARAAVAQRREDPLTTTPASSGAPPRVTGPLRVHGDLLLAPGWRVRDLVVRRGAFWPEALSEMTEEELGNLTLLAAGPLTWLAQRYGRANVVVTSSWRSPAHNEAVGGDPHSRHLRGQAADVVVRGQTSDAVVRAMRAANVAVRKAIAYAGGHVHLDYDPRDLRRSYGVRNDAGSVAWM